MHGTRDSCNIGMNALPDIYAEAQGYTAPKDECRLIRQCSSACVASSNKYVCRTYGTIKNLLKHSIHCSAYV